MSQVKIKDGKIPASAKTQASKASVKANLVNPGDLQINALMLDDELAQELRAKGLTWRFINRKKWDSDGFHKSYWVPYKRESTPSSSSVFSAGADGYTRRGDMILAVKTEEAQAVHRARIRQKTSAQSNTTKIKTDEFRKMMSDAGISPKYSKVHSGYEENGDDSEGDSDE